MEELMEQGVIGAVLAPDAPVRSDPAGGGDVQAAAAQMKKAATTEKAFTVSTRRTAVSSRAPATG